ncbi:hypothetical protein [Selenomonas ruminantium]|uniref:hypothetical protein n=1 Tax=Selenomonas ruminantium TaxID=971 RepID=UPI0026F10067|nr:hypothetical protein [Selenomonas ruminantium]
MEKKMTFEFTAEQIEDLINAMNLLSLSYMNLSDTYAKPTNNVDYYHQRVLECWEIQKPLVNAFLELSKKEE